MNIKQRILQIADIQDITKEKFFSNLGYSSANFRGKNLDKQVGSDVLEKIVTIYEISSHWLLTGHGSMYQENNVVGEPPASYSSDERERIIRLMEDRLRDKEKIIRMLEREVEDLRAKLPGAGSRAG